MQNLGLNVHYLSKLIQNTQCSSQSAPLRESRERSRDGPQQKRSRAIMALSFFNSQGLKRLCYFNYNNVPLKQNF